MYTKPACAGDDETFVGVEGAMFLGQVLGIVGA